VPLCLPKIFKISNIFGYNDGLFLRATRASMGLGFSPDSYIFDQRIILFLSITRIARFHVPVSSRNNPYFRATAP